MSVGHEYDVIVVGAGSSGSVMARRLVDAGRSVLLLEAGTDYRSAHTPSELRDPWPLGTLENEELFERHFIQGLDARRTTAQAPRLYWQGRGVGGSSAVNGLFAVRPTVEDLDEWASITADARWSYDACLALLNGFENDLDFGSQSYHGDRGAIPVARPRVEDFQSLETAFGEAASSLGHRFAPDHNAPAAKGWSPYAYNALHGHRVTASDAFLEPVRDSGRLRVIGEALTAKVLIDDGHAAGVVALVAGEAVTFRAAHVVLSAGVFNSPAILLRSGVGPADDLRALGIPVVAALPVGRGLQDHPGVSAVVDYTERLQPAAGDRRHCRVWMRFDSMQGSDDLVMAAMNANGFNTENAVGLGTVVGWLNRVTSRGTVRLASADPRVHPQIEFGLLSDPADLRLMRELLTHMTDVLRSPAMSTLADQVALIDSADGTRHELPDPQSHEAEQLALLITHDVQHATSTCRMGVAADPHAVVDSTGSVHGVDGLSVADASIFPFVPRANTNFSSYLVAEVIAAALT